MQLKTFTRLFISGFTTFCVFLFFYSTVQYNAAKHIGDTGETVHSYDYVHADGKNAEGYLVRVSNVDLYPGAYDVKCIAEYEKSEDYLVIVSSQDDKNFLYAASASVASQGMSIKVPNRLKAQIGVWYKSTSDVTIERLNVYRKIYKSDVVILTVTFLMAYCIVVLISNLKIEYAMCLLFLFLVAFHLTNYKWSGEISGLYTDHVSHINSTMLFDRVGFDVLMKPVDQIFRDINEAGSALHQSIGWSRFPRAYPPGVYALHYPFAALAWSGVPLDVLKTVPLILYLLCAHVLLFLFLKSSSSDGSENSVQYFMIFPVVFFSIIQWSMFGFYDIFSVLFVYLALRTYLNNNFVYFVFWSSLAVFFHYRALWYGLFYVYGFVTLLPVFLKDVKCISKRKFFVLFLSICLSACSLYSFKNLFPLLSNYPCQNLLSIYSAGKNGLIPVLFLIMSIIMVCLRSESNYIVYCMIGMVAVLSMTKQYYPWHSLFVLPLLMVVTNTRNNSPTMYNVLLFSIFLIISSGSSVLEVNMLQIVANKYFDIITSL